MLLALLVGMAGAAEPTWSAGVSADRIAFLASVAWFPSKAQGLWARRSLPHGLDVGLDVRKLLWTELQEGKRFEVGTSLGYAPGTGWYRPRVALSAGYSGGVYFDWEAYWGEGWEEQDPVGRADYRPLYAGVQIEPLAVRLGHFSGSVLGVDVSQMGWARVVRLDANLLRLGVAW